MSHYIYENQNSKSFYSMSWIAFGLSFVGMLIGLIYMEADSSLLKTTAGISPVLEVKDSQLSPVYPSKSDPVYLIAPSLVLIMPIKS